MDFLCYKQKAISNYFSYIGINDKTIRLMINNDAKCKRLFLEGKAKIPIMSKFKHRIELLKLSQSIYNNFIIFLVNSLKIITDIKNKILKDYFESKQIHNCRNVAFGFCFCKDRNGKYIS